MLHSYSTVIHMVRSSPAFHHSPSNQLVRIPHGNSGSLEVRAVGRGWQSTKTAPLQIVHGGLELGYGPARREKCRTWVLAWPGDMGMRRGRWREQVGCI